MKNFILTALLVCLTGTLTFAGAKGEENAIQRIKALGGKVEMGEGKRAGKVTKVDLSGTKVTDLDLRDLIELKELRSLDLRNTSITDGTQYIGFIKNLESLDLSETKVTDSCVAKLKRLKKLNSISVDSTAITDEGLKTLGKIGSLKDLSIADSKVTASGIADFKRSNPDVSLNEAE